VLSIQVEYQFIPAAGRISWVSPRVEWKNVLDEIE
jgi:hypothetical protein